MSIPDAATGAHGQRRDDSPTLPAPCRSWPVAAAGIKHENPRLADAVNSIYMQLDACDEARHDATGAEEAG